MIDKNRQAKALETMQSAAGGAPVARDPAALARYGSGSAAPAGVVSPSDEAGLAKILSAAREAGAVLQPVYSAGADAAVSARANAILLDLSGMNKVLEVNEELAYCLLEPGVTFRQLSDHIRENGLKLWIDWPGDPDESVAASFVKRRAGYTPYADHYLMQCGLEVMLADGKVVRTGMGAMPKSTCWQLFKFGYGPWIDGLFTQSDFAVVTKIGVWLMPQPPAFRPFAVMVPNEDDLGALLDILGPLKTNMVVPNGVAVANVLHEAARAGRVRQSSGKGEPLSSSAVRKIGDEMGLGYWTLYGSLYGLPENVALTWSMVRDAFAGLKGARVLADMPAAGAALWQWRRATMSGSVVSAPGSPSRWAGGSSVVVSPISPVDGEEAMRLHELSREITHRHGFDYVTEANAVWRSAQHRQFFSFGAGNGLPRDKAIACAREVSEAQAKAGFGQTLGDPALADTARAAYAGGGLDRLQAKVKKALDPSNLFISA